MQASRKTGTRHCRLSNIFSSTGKLSHVSVTKVVPADVGCYTELRVGMDGALIHQVPYVVVQLMESNVLTVSSCD